MKNYRVQNGCYNCHYATIKSDPCGENYKLICDWSISANPEVEEEGICDNWKLDKTWYEEPEDTE